MIFFKPFSYYVYSLTYNIKFVRGHILLMAKICFSYFNERNEFDHEFDISFSEIDRIREFNKNLLKNYDEELVNKGHFFIGSISRLSIRIGTFYYGNDRNDYVQIGRELEENGERVIGFFLHERNFTGEEKESEEKEPIINIGKSFKSNDCVICLTNPPNVLFCNCGHIAICIECDETKSLKNCPVCKTENAIKRII